MSYGDDNIIPNLIKQLTYEMMEAAYHDIQIAVEREVVPFETAEHYLLQNGIEWQANGVAQTLSHAIKREVRNWFDERIFTNETAKAGTGNHES